jgi:hypothetical protein
MRDTNGDLKADTKELVTRNYGRLEGSVEGNANSLLWGLDNWIHTSEPRYTCASKTARSMSIRPLAG